MSATPEREQAEALRTPEQMEWIRDRFKPDGLRRLARADRDYADSHGVYLPDVAALAYAEWERAEAAVERERELTRALAAGLEAMRLSPTYSRVWFDWARQARGALAGGVSAAGRPPEQAPHECQRCGSEEWTDVDYSGCSDCREAPEVLPEETR